MTTLNMILLNRSGNIKTGDVIQSYSSRRTCPVRCPFRDGKGCYADGLYTSRVWSRCEDTKDPRYIRDDKTLKVALTAAVLERLYKDPSKRVLFRHNVAGDLAVIGTSVLDGGLVKALSEAVAFTNGIFADSVSGYTYTHCKIDKKAAEIIHEAASRGFLINASCETVSEVLSVKDLGIDAVIASVDPTETLKALKDHGLHGVQCPAQVTEGMTCEKCRLCSKHRSSVVIFKVHGRAHKRATKVIMLKQGKV